MEKQYFVDLFAGCGGLSRGLENVGFHPVYVNELNSDALETYLVNRDTEYPLLREKHHSNNIQELTAGTKSLEALASDFRDCYGITSGELALVVGGPPCQGYSGIGIRRSYHVEKKEIPSNYLYKDMVKAIKKLKPKCFLFENVGGLLSGRWTIHGKKGEIWEDVKKSFESLKNYKVRWELIHAKSYGVPQNRPRIFLVGLRNDIPIDSKTDLPADGLLPAPTNDYPHLKELLNDLIDTEYSQKKYTDKYLTDPENKIQRKLRTTKNGKDTLLKGSELTEQEYTKHSDKVRKKFELMLKNGGKIPDEYKTKKFAQRVLPEYWNDNGPNITATSLADDYVHYNQPRILTVREWARLQMFPDWYRFAGNRTTGGLRRAGNPKIGNWDREVPKYTQIGNAVPVKLAEEIGNHLISILS